MFLQYVLRDRVKDDDAFVYASYLKHFHGSHPIKFIPNSLYFGPQKAQLAFLLEEAHCLVACFPEDPSECLGWVLYQNMAEALILHYVFIKSTYRRKGIAKAILQGLQEGKALVFATHACDNFAKLRLKAGRHIVYDPNLLRQLRKVAS